MAFLDAGHFSEVPFALMVSPGWPHIPLDGDARLRQRISAALLERMERVTGQKPHLLLRRGFFFSHRDLEALLTLYEQVVAALPSLPDTSSSSLLLSSLELSDTQVYEP